MMAITEIGRLKSRTVPKDWRISLQISVAARRNLSFTETFFTDNMCPAPLLLVPKFFESFGTVRVA
jgi:hypothetical protein